jgi:quaternary ammonium compound-resistance protein SugE
MNSAWLILICAGIAEIGWPVGLKISQQPGKIVIGIIIAIISVSTSGALLWLAQKEIPIGTAYAVWTGIGAVGTFLVGVFYFGDAIDLTKSIAIGLIVTGVILLNASH